MELMTYDLLLGPSSAEKTAKEAAQWAMIKQASDKMSDKKAVGWRKKIQSKPKELPPLKLSTEDSVTAGDSIDRRRHHGWLKTIQGSRPGTPVSGPPATPTRDEANDVQGERAADMTPRRDSRPKSKRITSLFGFKETSKGFDFAEPWGDERPAFEPYMDPKVAIQSIRSHMVNFSMVPIPLEHSNNLFRIFEDYYMLRDENERLESLLQEQHKSLSRSEDQWAKEERRYAEEVRRLELMIAQGATGMEG
jgi:hypothetical protein